MRTQKRVQSTRVKYALALAAYRGEQERMRYLLRKALGKYGKPKVSAAELRRTLDAELGDVSLSRLLVQMREEGY